MRLALLVARFCFVPTSLGSLGIRRTTGFGRVSWHARHVSWPVPRTRGERPCPNWRLLCYTFVRAQNCRQICGLCAQTPSSPSPPWSPFSSPSARSPLCSLRGCSSTFEVSICLACAFAACHIVTSCTPHLRARPCQLSDGAFADAPVLTACRLPLFAIVFLYQLSAADAAPTDSTDPGDAFIGAAAAVGTLATAAAKRLSSAGPASTCGKNSAGSKPLSLCVLFHLAQLCSRGTATGDPPSTSKRAKPAPIPSQSPGYAALEKFARARGSSAPPAPVARQLNKADATRATAALTLPNETLQRVSTSLAEFEVHRLSKFADTLTLSVSASWYLLANPGPNVPRYALPDQVTESPS